MKRALFVTDCDPVSPGLERRLRLAQLRKIYRDAGLILDILFLTSRAFDPRNRQTVNALFDEFDQIGILPHTARQGHRDQDNPLISGMMDSMRRMNATYHLVHLDQVLTPVSDRLGENWVLDTYDAAWEGPLADRAFDAILATFEDLRAHNTKFAEMSFRLPLQQPQCAKQTGRMIGWVGAFYDDLAGRWSELLELLAHRGVNPSDGILLAGAGANHIRVPRVLSPLVVTSDTPKPGAERALGLAVLPSERTHGWLANLTAVIAGKGPVLTTGTVAKHFEDRWHLPSYPDISALAYAIADWCEGKDRDSLRAAADASSQAFRLDSATTSAALRDALPVLRGSAIKA